MFKCQNSNICIHVGDICDGIFDCPFMDDEHLCLLQDVSCPSNCECLALAVGCFGADTLTINLIHVFPYIVVFLENCSMKFTHNILQKIGQVIILSVKRNNLISICSFMPSSADAYLYDIGFNSVSAIDKNCFKNGAKVVEIRLNNNLIEYLHPMAFMNLTSLHYLDLSNNNLLELTHVIFTYTKLKLVLIQNNNFIKIYPGMFNDGKPDLLVTNELGVSCKFYKSVLCTMHIPWYKVCSNLFPNIIIKILSYISFSLALIANCIHISVDTMLKNTKCRKSLTFGFTLNIICVNNSVYDGYLFIMIISDLSYGKTFPQNQQMWQEGPFCAIAFALSLVYSFMSLLLLSYLSMLRFLVIVYPLKFSINKMIVGIKPILFVSLSIILQASFLTVAVWLFSGNVSLVLCSPFIDPANTSVSIKLPAWVLLTLQQISCIFISVIYLLILSQIRKRDKTMEMVKIKSQLTFPLILQMICLVFSSLPSWISSSTILILTLTRNSSPIELIYWLHIIIMPINAITVPVIFLTTTARQWRS